MKHFIHVSTANLLPINKYKIQEHNLEDLIYPSIININKYHNMSLLTPAVVWAGYCWPGHTTMQPSAHALGMDKTWQLLG